MLPLRGRAAFPERGRRAGADGGTASVNQAARTLGARDTPDVDREPAFHNPMQYRRTRPHHLPSRH
jgi:hypothetical protein